MNANIDQNPDDKGKHSKEDHIPKKKLKKKAKKRKTGKKRTKNLKKVERPYPRATLEEALKIPYAIKEKNGGNPWQPDAVADAVDLSAKGNLFWYMSAASRDFGLTEGTRAAKKIELTSFGRRLVYAANKQEESELKLKAFLSVDLFNRVLSHYKGSDLPEMKYLSNTLQKDFNLLPETHDEFLGLFRKNCKFLNIGTGFSPGEHKRDEIEEDEKTDKTVKDFSVVTLVEGESAKAPFCFVIMPFNEKESEKPKGFFNEVLTCLIVPSGKQAGFTVRTANRSGSDVIQATIVNYLMEADLVLADLTNHNPNVMFELGFRMAIDKPVAIIRAKGTKPIFDVDNMLRVYEYDPNLWPSTVEIDLPDLVQHFKAVWKQRKSNQTYIKILSGRDKNSA
jgi:nucleoside 2-deoxyribosyltransferase